MSLYHDLAVWPLLPYYSAYGKNISGSEKLVQRFLIELLTPRGSDIYRSNRGSIFLTEWQNGITTEARLIQIFGLAEQQVRLQLQSEETDDDPDNERYVDASILKLEIAAEQVKLYLTVNSQAGTATVILPLSTE